MTSKSVKAGAAFLGLGAAGYLLYNALYGSNLEDNTNPSINHDKKGGTVERSDECGSSLLSAPVTELANDITTNIHQATALELVRMLRQVDAQVFSGWKHFEGIYDSRIIDSIVKLALKIEEALKSENAVVVMSGCGTSGRIAYYVARTFNTLLRHNSASHTDDVFQYLISGGDNALLLSDELPEDDPITGAEELQNITKGKTKVVFVGISCGLSAPYVAGQLDYALNQDPSQWTTVMLGFNPVSHSRQAPIELWNGRTFYDVAMEVTRRAEDDSNASTILINPVVGPEGITGSSRMKGGTATKIILETAISVALESQIQSKVSSCIQGNSTKDNVTGLLRDLEKVLSYTYAKAESISTLVDMCGASLRNDGHIYYVAEGTLGIMAFIDASEMPDTYGTPHTDVRAFLEGGWATMGNAKGDLTEEHELFCISLDYFEDQVLQTLTSTDSVIGISRDQASPRLSTILKQSKSMGASTGLVRVSTTNQPEEEEQDKDVCHVTLSKMDVFETTCKDDIFSSLAIKWVLNAITTGANVQNGMVLQNRMINLTVANNKLYYRSVDIVADFARVSKEKAENALLKSIYLTDEITPSLLEQATFKHIQVGTERERVIPLAILIAAKEISVSEAMDIMKKEHNIGALLA